MNTVILVIVAILFGIVLLALLAPIITVAGMLVALFGLLTGNGAVAGCGALAWLFGSALWLYVDAKPVYKVN
jgi:hypothetical protein